MAADGRRLAQARRPAHTADEKRQAAAEDRNAAAANHRAAAEGRRAAAEDRKTAAGERKRAAQGREAAAKKRKEADTERSEAAKERKEAAKERKKAARERKNAAKERSKAAERRETAVESKKPPRRARSPRNAGLPLSRTRRLLKVTRRGGGRQRSSDRGQRDLPLGEQGERKSHDQDAQPIEGRTDAGENPSPALPHGPEQPGHISILAILMAHPVWCRYPVLLSPTQRIR